MLFFSSFDSQMAIEVGLPKGTLRPKSNLKWSLISILYKIYVNWIFTFATCI